MYERSTERFGGFGEGVCPLGEQCAGWPTFAPMRHTLFVGVMAGLLAGCQAARLPTAPNYAAIRQELHRIYRRDQQIRESITAVGLDSPAAQPLFKQMHATDSVNQVYVRHLLATTGWPARSQVGDTAANTVYLVVQHAGRAAIAQHLPALRQRVRQGEAQATNAATMADRLRMFSGKKQRYGTQTANWVRQDGTRVVWPVQRPAHVNRYRRQVGFTTTVEQDAALLGAQYNPHERLPSPRVVMP